MARCCNDFSRTDLMRRVAAEAGRGLPAIEAGMPMPAGTGLDRRSFLARSAGLALAVYGGSAFLPRAFEEGIAAAAAAGPQRVLVSVFLDGGADSLSMLFPSGDPLYRQLRPRLALPASAGLPFAEDDRLRWHPSLAGLATLHQEREGERPSRRRLHGPRPVALHLPALLGGRRDERAAPHRLARPLPRPRRLARQPAAGPLARVAPPARARDREDAGRVDRRARPLQLLDAQRLGRRRTTACSTRSASLGAIPTGGDAALAQATSVARQAARLRQQLLPFTPKGDAPGFTSPVAYPKGEDDEFPRRLAGLAAMLGAGLPVRVVALTAPGMYDTHDDQPGELANGLKLTADSLLAFQRDLEARGLADRVLVHVWSEFGRRAKENGSNGTDHGAAGAGFLVGSRVNGQMIGEFPGLAKLDKDGNLRATSDFRGLYGSLLEQWLGADAEAIIPGAAKFARPKILR